MDGSLIPPGLANSHGVPFISRVFFLTPPPPRPSDVDPPTTITQHFRPAITHQLAIPTVSISHHADQLAIPTISNIHHPPFPTNPRPFLSCHHYSSRSHTHPPLRLLTTLFPPLPAIPAIPPRHYPSQSHPYPPLVTILLFLTIPDSCHASPVFLAIAPLPQLPILAFPSDLPCSPLPTILPPSPQYPPSHASAHDT